MTEAQRYKSMVTTNRWLETGSFLVGVLGLGFHMVADSLAHLGFRLGECLPTEATIPWVVVIAAVVLILPKTVGRARAGQIIVAGIQAITLRLTGRGAATAVLSSQSEGESASRPIAVATLPEGGGTAAVTVEGDADKLASVARSGKAKEVDE